MLEKQHEQLAAIHPQLLRAAPGQNVLAEVCDVELLMVNAENLNPIERSEDFDLLMKRIAGMRGKREFFSRGD